MKAILAAVFCGVFVGALGYEMLNRTRPEVVAGIRRKVADGFGSFFGTDSGLDELDDLDDFESEFNDTKIQAAA